MQVAATLSRSELLLAATASACRRLGMMGSLSRTRTGDHSPQSGCSMRCLAAKRLLWAVRLAAKRLILGGPWPQSGCRCPLCGP
eukprot:4584276-Prymnesium_polylepis.1